MPEFEFGQTVGFTAVLRRGYGDDYRRKEWHRFPTFGEHPVKGLVIGVRTLADGVVDRGGYEDGTTFIPEKHFRAYLVAWDMRRKPVFVLAEDLRILESSPRLEA